ncbi:MAG: hypothetical protein FWD73_03130 [Polyangiaceae bacterium]|nr:hypothetical protein [Polyangiaceae bacterium]
MRSLKLVSLLGVVAASIAVAAACSNASDTTGSSNGNVPRTTADVPTCESEGFAGADTDIDLGGGDRTIDIGDGHTVTVSNAHSGADFYFDWSSDVPIELIILRAGDVDGTFDTGLPATSGHVAEADVEGDLTSGLNRIAFCYEAADAGTDAEADAAPDATSGDAGELDGGAEDAGSDSGEPDSGEPDSGSSDSGIIDAGPQDAGIDSGTDSGSPDSGIIDAGPQDAGVDSGSRDSGSDAGVRDAGKTF